ncbi:MAG: sulfur carrier protein ThiS [Thermodesulfobacteriota bacterium]|nr:sulfur carrier protein ThiS [Thermodesulfobacteriota bacterium]
MITADDTEMNWYSGMTVADLLSQIKNTDFCAVVRLNKKLVSRPDFETTPIPDNAVIQLLPLVAGG